MRPVRHDGGTLAEAILKMENSIGEGEESAREVQQLAPERVIVKICHQRVHDRTTDCRRQHRSRNASLFVSFAHQNAVQAIHHLLEGRMVREIPHDHWIGKQCALHVSALDCEIDDSSEEDIAGVVRVLLGLGGLDCHFDSGQFRLGDCQNDLILGLELVIDGCLRHANGIGDHLQRRASDAVLCEELQGRVDDPGLRRAVSLQLRSA